MESNKTYKFRYSRRVIYLGAGHILIAAGLWYLLYYLYDGDYLSVWFSSVVVAILLLMFLSIPRRIVLTPTHLKVYCMLEVKDIKISNIVSAQRVNPRSLRWVMPLFAGFNFFGYYGIYFNVRRAERVRLYATEWRHFVEIVDIYDDKYYISCRQGEELVKELKALGVK